MASRGARARLQAIPHSRSARQRKELRERRGLTQAQVADRLDVDRSTVTKWELTGNVPLRKYRRKLCELLGCTEAELLANAAS